MAHSSSPLYGIPASELARICRVSLKTAQRWKAGQSVPDYCALALIERDLGCFAIEWRGWTIRGEDLISPDGWTVNRNDALIVPLMHGQIAALRSKVADLEATREGLEEQPQPGELPSIKSTG